MKKIINWWKGLEKVNGMRIIRNRVIPFPGYKAINLFGILFTKPNAKLDELTINHESIHSKQYKEVTVALAIPVLLLSLSVSWWFMFLIPFTFYIWYVAEWLIHLIRFKDRNIAYRRISFEMEAYTHDGDMEYLKKRKKFAFIK